MLSRKRIYLYLFTGIITTGLLFPQNFRMPVEEAGRSSYHPNSFWYYPWGKSGTHKGVDIFAKIGTPVRPATEGLVIYTGQIGMGGNVILVLGPKWRLHYYAHLNEIKISMFSYVHSDKVIGTVGTTGNAQGKTPHLHYTIVTIIPYIWQIDTGPQGWKKMFYINPILFLNEVFAKK